MHKIKKHFRTATTALLLSAPFATAVAAPVEIAATMAQPTLVANASVSMNRPYLEQSATSGQHALASTSRATVRKNPTASQPSVWALLLIGAGVLMLPRKRRADKSFS